LTELLTIKRLNKLLSRKYLPAKLFEENLEHIKELLGSAKNLKIKSKEYEFTTIEELRLINALRLSEQAQVDKFAIFYRKKQNSN